MKQVILGDKSHVTIVDTNVSEKIYAFLDINKVGAYKLHRVEDDKFAWISLNECECWANGVFDEAADALKCAVNLSNVTCYEFESIKEFGLWLSEI